MADSVSESAAREAPAESSAPPNSANQNGGAPQSRLALTLRALRHRNFQLFFGGQFISLIGTWMQTVAESWLVYRLTGSALVLGVVGFSSQIPVFLLSPLGGLVADRYNRHRVVIATQSAAMVLAGIYATLILGGWITVREIITLAAALGVVNAFDIPARQAFLVEMVGKEDLLNAIALNSSMFNGARVVGPAVAGVLVAWIGEGWCFAANSLSYIAVIVGLLLMSVTARETAGEGSMVEHIQEGFHYAQHTMPIRALLLLVGLMSLVGMPYSVLMPVFADQVLHGGARGLGLLMGATGVGAMLGALSLAMRSGVKGLGRLAALAGGGFGVSLLIFSVSRNFWLSFVVLVPVGFSMMLQMASSNTLIQAMVPDRLRGRVMSLYSMMFMGMAPLGSLFGGTLAEKIGAPWTVAIGGALSVVGAIWFYTQLPALRIEARQLIIAQGMAGGEPAEQMTARLR
ncbi:MAG TPA: MFS transporter [Candidatus Acidoferrales bacterium]|nr:MFS transporter [Candidatus Acidoferrales bacterium]